MVNQLDSLIEEIRALGNLLRKNKTNKSWYEIVDIKKNTTLADYQIDELLKKALMKFGIEVSYFSEEVPHIIQDRPKEYWLADPIDGTSSWLGGFDGYVIQAAFVKNNECLFSFIYLPEKDKFYHSYKGKGVFLNSKKLLINHNLNKTIVIVDNYPEPRGFVLKIMESFSNLKYLEMGSLGLKSLLVALSSCDLFIKTTRFRDWDVMPAKLFLNEVNFKMLCLNGNNINFGEQIEYDQGLLVYNPLKVSKAMIGHIIKMENKFEL